MKSIFFLFISLICHRIKTTALSIEGSVFEHQHDLKLFLKYAYTASYHYYPEIVRYVDALNNERPNQVVTFSESITNLIMFYRAVAQFGSVLVSEDEFDLFLADHVEDSAVHLTLFVINMSYVFHDLQKSIEEWQEDELRLQKPLTVMDEKPLEWFKKHGFDESTLNNVTILSLKEELGQLYGEGKPFNRMVAFMGTCALSQYATLASNLAWLATVGGNPIALEYLSNYLNREDSTVQSETASAIIEQLSILGQKEGPLHRLFGNDRNDGLYPFVMPILSKAEFIGMPNTLCWEILFSICSHIDDDFQKLRVALNHIYDITPTKFFADFGFAFVNKANVPKVLREIKSLMQFNTPISNLVNHVFTYEKEQKELQIKTTGRVERETVCIPRKSWLDAIKGIGMLAMGVQPVPRSLFLPDGGSSL